MRPVPPRVTPDMEEFLQKNPFPKIDLDELDKRYKEKQEERKKYSGYATAYQEMDAVSRPLPEDIGGVDPTKEIEDKLSKGDFDFADFPEYNEELEKIRTWTDAVQ